MSDYTGKPCPVPECDGVLRGESRDYYGCEKCGAEAHGAFLNKPSEPPADLEKIAREIKSWCSRCSPGSMGESENEIFQLCGQILSYRPEPAGELPSVAAVCIECGAAATVGLRCSNGKCPRSEKWVTEREWGGMNCQGHTARLKYTEPASGRSDAVGEVWVNWTLGLVRATGDGVDHEHWHQTPVEGADKLAGSATPEPQPDAGEVEKILRWSEEKVGQVQSGGDYKTILESVCRQIRAATAQRAPSPSVAAVIDTAEAADMLQRMAKGLEVRKRGDVECSLPIPHTDLFIGQLTKLASQLRAATAGTGEVWARPFNTPSAVWATRAAYNEWRKENDMMGEWMDPVRVPVHSAPQPEKDGECVFGERGCPPWQQLMAAYEAVMDERDRLQADLADKQLEVEGVMARLEDMKGQRDASRASDQFPPGSVRKAYMHERDRANCLSSELFEAQKQADTTDCALCEEWRAERNGG
jgi:hypothetical protein